MRLAISHLGYRPQSRKTVTLVMEAGDSPKLNDRLPFYIRRNGWALPRERVVPPGASAGYQNPFDRQGQAKLAEDISAEDVFYQGTLERVDSRWGTFWRGDFSNFERFGAYQIETDVQASVPFMIWENVYDRLYLGYLRFLRAQRCGAESFGVHPACHCDDGRLDDTDSFIDATGGWHDAGDFRKWPAIADGPTMFQGAVTSAV